MPELHWDWGTAYDLFVSLRVLHQPAEFGVRGAWAAGVRARLPAAEREMLEQSQPLVQVPLSWLYRLPKPKDAMSVLWNLGQIPAAERLSQLAYHSDEDCPQIRSLLGDVAARGHWDERDLEALQEAYRCEGEGKHHSSEELSHILGWWVRAEEFGERYVQALHAYQDVFFGEEEQRIQPALQDALTRAQDLAGRLALPDLLEELSQGLRFSEAPDVSELMLVPSYWVTPLMLFGKVSPERAVWMFGARPPDDSLVPGETVPDAMLRVLKALSDPTRLRILHYLTQDPQPPSQLARRLRLRLPTVMHHLKTLRLAGLVQVTLGEGKEVKRYAPRAGTIESAFATLQRFLKEGQEVVDEDAD